MGALGARLGRLGQVASWQALAEAAGARWGVDPALILAVIEAESGGYAGAINPGDPAYGLMQLTPATAAGLAGQPVPPDDLLDPARNIELGTQLLRQLLDRYDVPDALNAYRAGRPTQTARSQAYVARALAAYARWQAALAPAAEGAPTGPVALWPTALGEGLDAGGPWAWWALAAAAGLLVLAGLWRMTDA